MRFLDLAVAGLIGVTSLAAIAAWSPQAADDASSRAAVRGALYDAIARSAYKVGIAALGSAPVPDLCAAVSSTSNATFGLSARIGSYQCTPAPPDSAESVAVAVEGTSRTVTLEAWAQGGG